MFSLNIRQKVILGFATILIVIGGIAAFSYHYLIVIEVKQKIVENADDLRDLILEMRRYEKNYLLYGSNSDLIENKNYTKLALEAVKKIFPEIKNLQIAPQLDFLNSELLAYQNLVDQIQQSEVTKGDISPHSHVSSKLEEQLRESGKKLVDLSRKLVAFERQRILDIINNLKTQLLASLITFAILGIFFIVFISRKIIRPLSVIERTTHRIAQGDFRPLPVMSTRDETQQVVEAFNRMVSELERRQDQLVQSKKMSSLGILTAGIAHQLNNPLNNISTSCQIVLEELSQNDQDFLKKMLTNIEQEVNRARDIVKGLLEFSRVREFTLMRVALEDVVQRAIRLIASQVPPGIDIIDNIPPDLILRLDPQRMQEVFLNLFMNAIQAITETPGEIRIIAGVDEEHQKALITVEDTGVGIPKEELDRVFDPFFTTKDVGAGTGLGLSIVYGIIEKHQGDVQVESREGEGTRFTIRLPLPPRRVDEGIAT